MTWTNYGLVILILLAALAAAYISDRGLWNFIDRLALWLHKTAERGRRRQAEHTINMIRAWDEARAPIEELWKDET